MLESEFRQDVQLQSLMKIKMTMGKKTPVFIIVATEEELQTPDFIQLLTTPPPLVNMKYSSSEQLSIHYKNK